MANQDEFIEIDEVQVSRRGRKPVLDSSLLDILSKVPDGKAVRLSKTFGNVSREERASVSSVIRKHWAVAKPGVKPRIDYTQDGVPQVRAR